MTWSLQNSSSGITTLRHLSHEGTVRPTELVEALCERSVGRTVPSILAPVALPKTLQGLPQVAGSAA
jgi:hypothetical protein